MRATRAIIDVDAFASNYNVLRKIAGKSQIMAMVKANAYGHGMVPIARIAEELGVEILGVAFVDEARLLRDNNVQLPIVVLTPFTSDEVEAMVALDVTGVACDLVGAEALNIAAGLRGKRARLHLYVDTGMHREGFAPTQALDAARQISCLPHIALEGICTHFATSDDVADPFFQQQLSTFTDVVEQCSAAGITFASVHAANTGALLRTTASHFTMIRPGLSLYGYSPIPEISQGLRPVMSIRSRVNSVRRIAAGDSVSYGRAFVAAENTTIVTVPIGYGDGYSRRMSGSALCSIGGIRYPVVGRICMDEIMVDVGDADVAIGADVELMGHEVLAQELALWQDSIPYEVVTAVSARVPRVYVGDPMLVKVAMKGVSTRV